MLLQQVGGLWVGGLILYFSLGSRYLSHCVNLQTNNVRMDIYKMKIGVLIILWPRHAESRDGVAMVTTCRCPRVPGQTMCGW